MDTDDTTQGPEEKRPRLPNPMRMRISCPSCGWICADERAAFCDLEHGKGFTCGRCGDHFAAEDFWEEHEQKRQAMRHNHAQADLSQEEDE